MLAALHRAIATGADRMNFVNSFSMKCPFHMGKDAENAISR